MQNELINLGYLNLMSDNDVAIKQVMLDMIIEELPQEVDKLELFSKDFDWQQVHEVSHKLKSTLAFVGSDVMTALNNRIMDFSKMREELDQVPFLVAQLQTLATAAVPELQSALATIH